MHLFLVCFFKWNVLQKMFLLKFCSKTSLRFCTILIISILPKFNSSQCQRLIIISLSNTCTKFHLTQYHFFSEHVWLLVPRNMMFTGRFCSLYNVCRFGWNNSFSFTSGLCMWEVAKKILFVQLKRKLRLLTKPF